MKKKRSLKSYSKKYRLKNPQPGSKDIEMIGLKFGLLTVVSYSHLNKYGNKLWLCLCDCGKLTNENTLTTRLRSGRKKSCGCAHYSQGEGVYNYSGYKDITGTKWNSVIMGAKMRGLEFNITKEMVWDILESQGHKCYLSNIPISFKDKTASVDRIDSAKGYTADNIALTHKDLNIMKGKYPLDYFIKMCALVARNNDK